MRRAVEGRCGLPEPTTVGAAGELVNGQASPAQETIAKPISHAEN